VSDEEDLFAKMVGAVRPIKGKERKVSPEAKPRKRPRPVLREHPLAASTPLKVSDGLQSTHDPWTFKSSGVSPDKLKKLAAGNPPARMELDLHGMTRDEALQALQSSIDEALERGDRAICVVHGRGLHSQGKPVLKEAVYQWLRSGPYAGHILAATPKPNTGGGSALILLRRKRS